MKKGESQKDAQGKPIQVLDIDISVPIDIKKAIEGLGGEPFMFYTMLAKFEDMSLIKQMSECAKAVDERDFLEMKNAAHSLKGSSGYIGASHLHYACYFIQEHYIYERYDQMMESFGGRGELVTEPDEIAPALKRAFDSGEPTLVNILTDPAIAYPRSANLA